MLDKTTLITSVTEWGIFILRGEVRKVNDQNKLRDVSRLTELGRQLSTFS